MSLERREGQFICKSQAHLRMLQHVVEAQILYFIFGRVDLLIRILELRLDDEGRGVAETAGRGMVGAGITALGLDVGYITVLQKMLAVNQIFDIGITDGTKLTVVMTPLIKLVNPWST